MSPASPETPFRDLNKNGRMDRYEDPSRPLEERVEDLLAQMTLEEKAGMLFHTGVDLADDGQASGHPSGRPSPIDLVTKRAINHVNLYAVLAPRRMAEAINRLQAAAEATRLGIPVTVSSDPRHGFSSNPGASAAAGAFSQWPEPLGLAATRDAALVEQFGDIARQEYVATGIRAALHPMADLATEPRWARINGTFGEDAELAAEMVAAYIRGFQGKQLGSQSVACMTKHFPGGGPQKDGEDPHFPYGREQIYPGENFEYHLIPFAAAFAAGTAQIMPYYGMPTGTDLEEVGFGFNRQVITELLRERFGFDGVVCTDWGLLHDSHIMGKTLPARSWGVEHLSVPERAKKALDAGVDQFGGEACPEIIVDLVKSGQISEARLDVSVRRLLRDKFRLGLFDNPYLDVDAAEVLVGNDKFRTAGELAQRKSIVLLKNEPTPAGRAVPLAGRPKLYLEHIAVEVAQQYGEVVATLEEADFALLRIQAPYEPRDTLFLEAFFHAGDLSFNADEEARLLSIMRQTPTIVDIYLDRPAVIPTIAANCVALYASFGASDAALLDLVFGRFAPTGKLPFELPASMAAVREQKSDVPYDSVHPLFPFGHGLTG